MYYFIAVVNVGGQALDQWTITLDLSHSADCGREFRRTTQASQYPALSTVVCLSDDGHGAGSESA